MIVLDPDKMRRLDGRAIGEFGVPGVVLMEAAGTMATILARSLLGERLKNKGVVIVCGGGNNGGDGMVVARHLAGRVGWVDVFLLAEPERLRGEAAANWRLLETLAAKTDQTWARAPTEAEAHGVRPSLAVHIFNSPQAFSELEWSLEECDLVVDGIFGTGFHGRPTGEAMTAIKQINACRRRSRLRRDGAPLVLALDIPSGVDGATGQAARAEDMWETNSAHPDDAWLAVAADVTVTFGHLKTGLVQHPGIELAGTVYVADIGLPPATRESETEDAEVEMALADVKLARSLLPVRPEDGNKGTFGRALIVAGSAGMSGAAVLAGRAAVRAGAGLVTVAVPHLIQPIVAGLLPEALTFGLSDTGDGRLGPGALPGLEGRLPGFDAAAAGPGLGSGGDTGENVLEFLRGLIAQIADLGKKLVLDADALNAVARDREAMAPVLRGLGGANLVLTPHPGEMARLLGSDVKSVQADRVRAAREAASLYGATVVLKGAGTVIATPEGRVTFNPTGNPALAVGGTGDVLTGVIVALLAQGLSAWEAAVAGAFWHGLAADLWAKKNGSSGLVASELADLLPQARREILVGTEPPYWRWHELGVAASPGLSRAGPDTMEVR